MSDSFNSLKGQVELMDMLYMRMVAQCKSKCLAAGPVPYKESTGSDLSKGESVCLDRCVSKYFLVFEKISTVLAERSQDLS